MSSEVFLVTGALGCVGSWTLRLLVSQQVRTVATDLSTDRRRVEALLSGDELSEVTFCQADITDLAAVQDLVEKHQVTHIVHLAGLQVPFCKADPSLGARVNVVGTINMFESFRSHSEQVRGLCYASSIAVMGPSSLYSQVPVPDDALLQPSTLYGVYKQGNESSADLYWTDWQIGSVGLRPYIVYGVGRDQGLTSDIAKAILAAVLKRSFEIKFSGLVALQYTADVAEVFIQSARSQYQGHAACNLRNDVIEVARFVEILSEEVPGASITYRQGQPLPFPADMDDRGLRSIIGEIPHTPLRQAIRETATRFEGLLEKGLIDLKQLDS